MITLIKDQTIIPSSDYLVKNGGDYNELDLVEVYNILNPSITVAYLAKHIVGQE